MQDSLDFSIIEHGSRAYEQACLLRDEILRKPLGMSLFDEDLDAESGFIHVAGLDDTGATQAYLYLKPIDDKVVKMKQVKKEEKKEVMLASQGEEVEEDILLTQTQNNYN